MSKGHRARQKRLRAKGWHVQGMESGELENVLAAIDRKHGASHGRWEDANATVQYVQRSARKPLSDVERRAAELVRRVQGEPEPW